MNDQPVGPNVKELLIEVMARIMIPPGSGKDSVLVGMRAITKPGGIGNAAKDAMAEVRAMLAAVKATNDNPFGDDDEAIAGELLRLIAERKAQQRAGQQRAGQQS